MLDVASYRYLLSLTVGATTSRSCLVISATVQLCLAYSSRLTGTAGTQYCTLGGSIPLHCPVDSSTLGWNLSGASTLASSTVCNLAASLGRLHEVGKSLLANHGPHRADPSEAACSFPCLSFLFLPCPRQYFFRRVAMSARSPLSLPALTPPLLPGPPVAQTSSHCT